MKLEVDCYSGRTADERPIGLRPDGNEYIVERCLTSGTDLPIPISKSAPMTAISTFCAEKLRRLTDRGIWSHFGNCHVAEGSPIISSRPSFSPIS